MTPSTKQTAIYDCWENEDCNILTEAVAGAGKTSTLIGLLERSKWRTLFLAFNKSIQTEIEEIIKARGFNHAKALTLHSLGLSSIREYYRVSINNNKKWDILKRFKDFHENDFRHLNYKKKMSVYFTLMDMLDVYRIYCSRTYEDLVRDMNLMGKYVPEIIEEDRMKFYWEHFKDIYIDATFKDEGSKIDIDFMDMIFIPVMLDEIKIVVKPYYLFVDECQDLNMVQHLFIEKLLGQGDVRKWVAVGDSRQSIYGFSGSYSKSFEIFREKENVKTFPLDVCYRSAKKIVEQANLVYPVMTAFQEENGYVGTEKDISLIKPASMVVCRNTAPLIDLYFNLISLGKEVYIKGEDILSPTINYLKKNKNSTVKKVLRELGQEIESVSEKKNDNQRIRYYVLSGHYENITTLANYLKKLSVNDLLEDLEAIANKSKQSNAIELSTIHKSKGREADVVYILEEKLIPSPFATTPEQIQQEINLKYVARTRAKKELYYLNLK